MMKKQVMSVVLLATLAVLSPLTFAQSGEDGSSLEDISKLTTQQLATVLAKYWEANEKSQQDYQKKNKRDLDNTREALAMLGLFVKGNVEGTNAATRESKVDIATNKKAIEANKKSSEENRKLLDDKVAVSDFSEYKTEADKKFALKSEISSTAEGSQSIIDNKAAIAANSRSVAANTDGLERLNQSVAIINKDLRAGIAGVTALAMIPQAEPGRMSIGAGIGHYNGQGALAVGFSQNIDSHLLVKGGAALNTRRDFNLGVGIGYQW